MKPNFIIAVFIFSTIFLAHGSERTDQSCFLLQELDSGKIIKESDPKFCAERQWPCSSFKLPLAVMGFDSGVLKDENTTFKWDGTKQPIKTWEADHNVRSWLKESVVWYSQRITPLIGLEKIKKYLKDFQYGNEDFSGGITQAWLESSLKISPREQLSFLRRLARKELKISDKSVELALSLLPVSKDTPEQKVSGKTGSGVSRQDPPGAYRVGWYVGYATFKGKRYVFAAALKLAGVKGKFQYAGPEAKEFTLKELSNPL
jgi:beta-lactamase class D